MIYLSWVFHDHQPVGQFDFVCEHSIRAAYQPFFDLMDRHPAVHCAVHLTGSLLDYLIANHPALLDQIRRLVERGQLEVLSGGYYEPVLAALPDEDKIGQIEKLNRVIEDRFGMRPRGLWLAERVWEPHLVKPIAQAGIDYVVLDDSHFEAAGCRDLFGYFITEEQAYTVAAFPTLTHLRQTILWEPVSDFIEWLHEQTNHSTPKLAFLGDDGEKFGVWPGTYERAWGDEQYMDTLFTAIEQASDWLTTIRPMDYLDQHQALGRVYLPTASYVEMGQWSLPPERFRELQAIRQEFRGRDDVQRYLTGSTWRSFMVKYDEVNHMHKRMLMVARKVHAMSASPDKQQALDYLWRAQANDAYWHGLFGGIYLFNFRVENYANLIAAESLADGLDVALTLDSVDFNKDGAQEIVLTGDPFNAIWTPDQGGMLLELDSRPHRYNLLNIMMRREEGYHHEIRAAAANGRLEMPNPAELMDYAKRDTPRAKETGIEQYLIYDWYRRGSFIDHFLTDDADVHDLYRSLHHEQGDFVGQPYHADCTTDGQEARVILTRTGHIRSHPVKVQKQFTFRRGDNRFRCFYQITNQSTVPLDLHFAVELASGFDGGQVLRYCHLTVNDQPEKQSLVAVAAYPNVTRHTSVTSIRSLALTTHLSQPCDLWTYPLETVTNSEAGYERGYQGTIYVHVWSLHLNPNAVWTVMIDQQVNTYN